MSDTYCNYRRSQILKPTICLTCNENFSDRSSLEAHQIDCLAMNSSIVCEYCSNQFPTFLIQDHYEICGKSKSKISPFYHTSHLEKGQNNQEYAGQYSEDEKEMEEDDDDGDENKSEGGYDPIEDNPAEEVYTDERILQLLEQGVDITIMLKDHDQTTKEGGIDLKKFDLFPTMNFKKSKNKSKENKECPVCMEEYVKNQVLTTIGCLHFFHRKCIRHWLNKNSLCPICKIDQKTFLK